MAGPSVLSDLLGYASIGCWLGAQFPQVLENIRRQSCEGLALPFLANWLLGDISNLVGCLLTNQLPFQTWLATYFVFVDCALVAQYFYYYRPVKIASPVFGHTRAATTPGLSRRMSVDRGASRYRTLSTVASHVAQAAALAAQQDESDARAPRGRHTLPADRTHAMSASVVSRMTDGEDEMDDSALAALSDSFHSEGGRDIGRKRVSWSIERNGGRRSGSVGRHIGISRNSRPTPLHLASSDSLLNDLTPLSRGRPIEREEGLSDVAELAASITPSSRRESRASRRGATMVFLSAWALFGIGTLAGSKRGLPSRTTTNIGRVLWTGDLQVPDIIPDTPFPPETPPIPDSQYQVVNFKSYGEPPYEDAPHEPHPTEPSAERIIGRIFAWLCTTLYLTSRLPQIWKNFARKSVEGLSMYLFVFAFLGNTFYVASLLMSPKIYLPPPTSTEYIRESIPYLLGSGGTLIFDITIVGQSFIYRPRPRRLNSTHSRIIEEEAGLLAGDPLSAHPQISAAESAVTSRASSTSAKSMNASLTSPPPEQLHALVLDYLCHNGYMSTAKAFAQDSTVRQLDADGDEIIPLAIDSSKDGSFELSEELFEQIAHRKEIEHSILAGRVDQATELLNKYFPSVLAQSSSGCMVTENADKSRHEMGYLSATSTDPLHLSLNLRILAFTEACRTIPLEYPLKPVSGPSNNGVSTESSMPEDSQGSEIEKQISLIDKAKKLYAFAKTLPDPLDRAAYQKEIENIGCLLAFEVPETSSVSAYLSMERRQAVGDQIKRAILKRTGHAPISKVELCVRYTHVLWLMAHHQGIKPRPGVMVPPTSNTPPFSAKLESNDAHPVPPFNLSLFLDKP
ncbi:PQ loop repeat-domain-containing protein [Crucibulum laeve]|uniref:PQ loop repeat-domain-containing protein n=1 Tax=Crucibulum laeve TaxID=68775 RepID=A0A5C3MMX0_9AGAR|nr:PQ loop repeat-domain-containing protein [Crucibulum laeve]